MPRKRVKFGISYPNFSLKGAAALARLVEKSRLDSVWVNDDIVGVFQRETFDAELCLSEMARATERISVGSAVLATYRRHPVNTAISLISLDHLSRGRLVAGLGSCCPSPEWGFPASDDVADRFVEFMRLLKMLLRGGPLEFQGKFFGLKTPGLPVKPRQRPHPPLWAAANLNRTIRMIAEVADGWLPICVPPQIYSAEMALLNESAERAGRGAKEIVKGCMAFIVLSRAKAQAVKKAMPLLAQTALWFGAARVRKMGLKNIKTVEDVTPQIVQELNIVGTVEDAAQRIGQYIDAGVEHLVLQPLPIREIQRTVPLIVEAIGQAV